MIENAKKWLEDNYENMLLDLADLIACPSVKSSAEDGKPFGQGCYDALMCVKGMCEKFGFTFHNLDGYIGYMDYEDRGEMPEYGVLVHVDVVPPCDFTTDPYMLIRKNGKLIARGVMDDKGPCVIIIYVLAALKKVGFIPEHNVRLLFGCDEESGWQDIEYAKKHGVIPKRGYSPDADYPLINKEKGILTLGLNKELKSDKIMSIKAGEAVNAVPDICEALLGISKEETEKLFESCNVKAEIEETEKGCHVRVKGRASHASIPHQGDNAGIKMLSVLKELDTNFTDLYERFKNVRGTGLGFSNVNLTCTLSKIDYNDGKLKLNVDMRHPHDIEFNQVDATIKSALRDFEIDLINHNPIHSVDENDPLCTLLLKAYEMETGNAGRPRSIGGGTYSRAFETGVAFGCTFEHEPMCAHMADEFMLEESVKMNLRIQLQGIYQLCR